MPKLTVKQWFETISDDYIRHTALKNLEDYLNVNKDANIELDSLHDAIRNGFPHSFTNENESLEELGIDIEEKAFNGTLAVMASPVSA